MTDIPISPLIRVPNLLAAVGSGLSVVRAAGHRFWACFALVIASLATVAIRPLDLLDWPTAAAVLILVLGVPHGALDIEILKHRRNLTSTPEIARGIAGYVGLACVVLLTWAVFPSVALSAFLVVSAYHFGGDWRPSTGIAASWILGATVIAAPALLHHNQISAIFAWLVPAETAIALATVLQSAAPLLLIVSAAVVLRLKTTFDWRACDVAVVLATAVVLPPISFFVVYFCAYHSISHVVETRQELCAQSNTALAVAAAPYALAAIAATLLGSWPLMPTVVGPSPIGPLLIGAAEMAHAAARPALLSAIFIALAALTVPHMLLVDLLSSPRHPSTILDADDRRR